MNEKETSPLKVLFPEAEVGLWPGKVAKVRPLFLEDLPKVLSAFQEMLNYFSENPETTLDVLIPRFSDLLMQLVPLCVSEDPKKIPIGKLPEIIEIMVEQNFPKEALGKWTALFSSIAGAAEKQGFQSPLTSLSPKESTSL